MPHYEYPETCRRGVSCLYFHSKNADLKKYLCLFLLIERLKMYEITENTDRSTRSPCLTCERKDKDKSRCALVCKRLDAFRRGRDYSGLPIPTEVSLGGHGDSESGLALCTRCEKHPASKDDELCRWCRRTLKRQAAKATEAA